MGNHTPGPWEVELSARGFEIQKDNCRLGEMHDPGDARLVAAAPELLAAAIAALSAWERPAVGRVNARSALLDAIRLAMSSEGSTIKEGEEE